MFTFIIVLIVIVGILLGLVILVQNPKGGGLATGFSAAHQIGGVQRTAHFLEKATWYLAIALMVLCLAASWAISRGTGPGGSNLGDSAGVGGVGTEQVDSVDSTIQDGGPAGEGTPVEQPQD
jgi:preprotein translocase subunit SecG